MTHKIYHGNPFKMYNPGTSIGVQWLRLYASTIEGTDSIPVWGAEIPRAMQYSQKKKKMFSSVVCSTFTALLQPLPLFCSRSFSSSQKEILYLLSNHSLLPLPQVSGSHSWIFWLYVYPLLDISHKWNHGLFMSGFFHLMKFQGSSVF